MLEVRPQGRQGGERAMPGYGQFCPVAKAMEVLDERWTLLVVRELVMGSRRFNELRRGVPRMSPALLSKRLRSLELAGVVRRESEGSHTTYNLTQAGRELEPVVRALGAWGVRWIGELGDRDLDPRLLMWDMRRNVPVQEWPRTRTTVAFRFDDVPARQVHWWIIVAEDDADVCDFDPGYDVAATVHTSLRTLSQIWRGDISWERALGNSAVRVEGPAEVRRAIPTWLGQGSFASVPRIA
jgi:DNA-binding HxlR family transcriptional regulator